MSETVKVPELAKQTESRPIEWDWVDRCIWTDAVLGTHSRRGDPDDAAGYTVRPAARRGPYRGSTGS